VKKRKKTQCEKASGRNPRVNGMDQRKRAPKKKTYSSKRSKKDTKKKEKEKNEGGRKWKKTFKKASTSLMWATESQTEDRTVLDPIPGKKTIWRDSGTT